MTPKLTKEMRAALEKHPNEPVSVEDDRTHKVYLLIEQDRARDLLDQWLRSELQIGFEQANRGDITPWHPDRIKSEGRRRLQDNTQHA